MRVVYQREAPKLLSVLKDFPELTVVHPPPDVLDVAEHEVLHVHLVRVRAGRQDVGQVRQLLDHDDAVVTAGLKQGCQRVSNQHRNEN